jgi:hypothetical protein
VILRALPDYDTLFGVDFTPAPTLSPEPGSETGLGSVVAVSDEQVDLNACAPAANPVAVSVPVPDPLVFLRDTDAGPAVTAEVIG